VVRVRSILDPNQNPEILRSGEISTGSESQQHADRKGSGVVRQVAIAALSGESAVARDSPKLVKFKSRLTLTFRCTLLIIVTTVHFALPADHLKLSQVL